MALTESQLYIAKMLVKYYGYVGSWEIDHWKNYNLLIKAGYEEIADKNNLNNDDEANEATSSKKETRSFASFNQRFTSGN
mgnify:CR=1 FL=1